MKKTLRGFTLIELLVVIFIIGLLASIVIVSVNNARIRARDTRRIADLDGMRKAVEMYINANSAPPGTANTLYSSASWGNLQTALLPYINVLPHDPREGTIVQYVYRDNGTGGCDVYTASTFNARYFYKSDGTGYKIGSILEQACNGINTNDGGVRNDWYEVGSNLTITW